MTAHSSIADTSEPNAGRIYDYLLGGHHNFEVDRQTAENLLQIAPFMPQVLRLIRWFLGEATRRLVAEGYDKFLDFASGLPTVDHIHHLAGPQANVIYSDIDPVTVEYGRKILKDNDGVRFVRCDAGKPEELLNSGVVQELFAENRKLAIGFNGIAYFLPDEKLKYALQTLYNWTGKGSKLFFCDADADASEVTNKLKPVFELYAKIGQPIYIRSKDKLLEMAKPWNVDEPGFQTLDEWIGMGETVTQQEKTEWGGKGFYGVIFSK
jgi:O-methyltransferase involved in polyketide biosynthesis